MDEKRIAKQEEILQILTKILRGEERGTALVGMGMGEQSIDQVKPTVAEKIKAAELLGKRYTMWTDKQQVEVEGVVTFIDQYSARSGLRIWPGSACIRSLAL